MRLISLVPSLTELLCHLELKDQLVGRTKFCVHPSDLRSIPKIGGTKTVDVQKVIQLQPDLVVANKEENVKEQVEELQTKLKVYTSDISSVEDAFTAIETIGDITKTHGNAKALVTKIQELRSELNSSLSNRPKVAYVIWNKPYMTVGGDTFIHSMLNEAGFDNIFRSKRRYPEFTLEELLELNPDFLFLSSEPFPFIEKHVEEISSLFPKERILLVDGEYFSWYGSRMLGAFQYFRQLKVRTDQVFLR